MALLEGPSLKQAEVIKQELGEGSGDLARGVRDLRNLLAASPNLPQPGSIDDHLLELFVRGCRMNTERARAKLEAFCIARARCRDLYEHHSLTEPPLNNVKKFIDIVPLPNLTDEGYRVTIFRIKENYPDSASDITDVIRVLLMLCDVRMVDETLIAGDVFVYEMSQCRMGLATRLASSLGSCRRGIHLAQAAYPQRLKRVHIVGAAPMFISTCNLIMNYVNDKVRRRYLFHATVDDLLDYMPARILPIEWGGEEQSIDIMAKKWSHRINECRDYLRDLYEVCNATPEPINNSDIYGTMGAFRKLDID